MTGGAAGGDPAAALAPGHARPAPDACSVGFDRAAVSAYGTAARAGFFVALEQAGPWGRDAATQSHLPADLGRTLSAACSERGGRLSLVRRPGRHADAPHEGRRAAYLGWAGRDPWLLRADLTDPAQLLDVDFDALARGAVDVVRASLPTLAPTAPILLVCTNGRRDVCCAVRGRPVVLEAATTHPDRVWEASHTGGHRYAPTGVLLPHGATLARLDAALAGAVLDAADHGGLPAAVLGPWHDRGRSPLEPAAQAAESHVRQLAGITALDALECERLDGAAPPGASDSSPDSALARYAVTHRDGRRWEVACERRIPDAAPELAESCGKAAVAVHTWAPRVLR